MRATRMNVSSPTRRTSSSNSPDPLLAKYMMMSVSGAPCSSMGTNDSPNDETVIAATASRAGKACTQSRMTRTTESESTCGSRLALPGGFGYSI